MTINEFITLKYKDIIIMTQKICKGNEQSEEVSHYVISQFLENPKSQALIDTGDAMSYLSGAIWRSFNSSTSPYHTIYRQKGRVHSMTPKEFNRQDDSYYDFERDSVTEEVYGILTDMEVESIDSWYRATIMKMYIECGNYSEIARKTGIPRTSISHAVNETKEYIKQTLKNRGIEWNYN